MLAEGIFQCRGLERHLSQGIREQTRMYLISHSFSCKIHMLEFGQRMPWYQVAVYWNTRGYFLQLDISIVVFGRRLPCGIPEILRIMIIKETLCVASLLLPKYLMIRGISWSGCTPSS